MQEYLDFQDVLLMPDVLSRFVSRKEPNIFVDGIIPISIANMENIGTLEVAKIAANYKIKTYIDKHTLIADWKRFISENPWEIVKFAIPTIGVSKDDFEKGKTLWYLLTQEFGSVEKTICFDVANGHIAQFLDFVANSLSTGQLPFDHIVYGNIANPKIIPIISNKFSKAKTVSIKCGIGSGSVCTTRLVTGVGVPQFTLIQECKKYKPNRNVRLISDGGIRNSGDILKAFAAGADEVMMGGMFAGLVETTKKFYGSSSKDSTSNKKKDYAVPEGKTVNIDRKKTLDEQIYEIIGGLQSGLTYIDYDLEQLISDVDNEQGPDFIKVRRQTDNY